MKILFVATVRSHIGQFHMPFIRELKAHGVEVHAAFKTHGIHLISYRELVQLKK